MNFSQKLGLFILILISVVYVYCSFFSQKEFEFNFGENNIPQEELEDFHPTSNIEVTEGVQPKTEKKYIKKVKIFVTDSGGNIRSVNRDCDISKEQSCFEFAIKELVNAPSQWEKSKGFSSEIPQGTKVLSVRESSGNILVDLSSSFESGGGAESTYTKINQVIKTANANTKLPVYLYINGRQANVIGGEGVMVKQPLNERSLDE